MALAILVVQRATRNMLPENLQIKVLKEPSSSSVYAAKAVSDFMFTEAYLCIQKVFLYVNIIKLGSPLITNMPFDPPSPPRGKAYPYEGV